MSICAICTGRHDEADCPRGIVYRHQCRPVIRPAGWRPTVALIHVEAPEPQRAIAHQRRHPGAIRGIRVG